MVVEFGLSDLGRKEGRGKGAFGGSDFIDLRGYDGEEVVNLKYGPRGKTIGEKLQQSRFWLCIEDNFLLELLTSGVGSPVPAHREDVPAETERLSVGFAIKGWLHRLEVRL